MWAWTKPEPTQLQFLNYFQTEHLWVLAQSKFAFNKFLGLIFEWSSCNGKRRNESGLLWTLDKFLVFGNLASNGQSNARQFKCYGCLPSHLIPLLLSFLEYPCNCSGNYGEGSNRFIKNLSSPHLKAYLLRWGGKKGARIKIRVDASKRG